MRVFKRAFAANEEQEISIRGSFVRVDSSTAPVHVRTPERELDVSLKQGQSAHGESLFNSIIVKNGSQSQVVSFIVGRGRIEDSNIAGEIDSQIKQPGALTTPPDVSVSAGATAEILPENTKRDHVVIVADSGNAGEVRIGGAGVGASAGPKLAPEQSITIQSTGAVYVYNPQSSAAVFQILEGVHV